MPATKKALNHIKRLLLVIPTYQEIENLFDSLSDCLSILEKQSLESHILVVDDNSQELLGLELTLSENSPEVVTMIEEIAQEVQAEVLVSDDLGSY